MQKKLSWGLARNGHVYGYGRDNLGITEGGEVEVDGERDCAINLAEAATHVLLKALHMHSQQRRTPAQRTAITQRLDPDDAYAEEYSYDKRQMTDTVRSAYNTILLGYLIATCI